MQAMVQRSERLKIVNVKGLRQIVDSELRRLTGK